MAYVEKGSKTEIGKKIEELAKKLPAPLSYAIPDPYSDPTGGFGLTPVGLMKSDIQRSLLKPLFGHAYVPPKVKSEAARTSIADAIRVLKKLPRKTVESIKEFQFLQPEAPAHGGAYWQSPERRIRLSGGEDIPQRSLARALAHESGHETTERMLDRMFGPVKGRFGEIIRDELWQTHGHEAGPFEGIAEYLSSEIRKAAGVNPTMIAYYGPKQAGVIEKLQGMPSKNPYMNVYRYLQEVLDPLKQRGIRRTIMQSLRSLK